MLAYALVFQHCTSWTESGLRGVAWRNDMTSKCSEHLLSVIYSIWFFFCWRDQTRTVHTLWDAPRLRRGRSEAGQEQHGVGDD